MILSLSKRIIEERRWIISFCMVCLLQFSSIGIVSLSAQKQTDEIRGVVKDRKGEVISGAVIATEDRKAGTTSQSDGTFKLNVPIGTKLIASLLGHNSETFVARSEGNNVVLTEASTLIEGVQVVAYGTQKKVTVTGALSTLSGTELVKAPMGSVSSVLAGAMPGISAIQSSGQPGADGAVLYVRGKGTWGDSSPLIQVDGVERDFDHLDPNEIESITVLKDASATAVFGVRGANGVVLITTKRGTEGKMKISFSTSVSLLSPTKPMETANSYEYANFHNMIKRYDTDDLKNHVDLFSPAVIQKFKDHSDPLLYPDIDWLDYTMKKNAVQTKHNINISGGSKIVRYFVSVGAHTQEGIFKEFDLPYDVTYQYKRFNYRSNLDINVTKTTTLSIGISGWTDNNHRPYTGQGVGWVFRNLYYATPFSSPGLVDGKFYRTSTDYPTNPLPFTGNSGLNAYYGIGYMQTSNNALNADLALNQKLDFITKGLSFRIKGAYNSNFVVNKSGQSSIASYSPFPNSDGTMGYRKSGSDTEVNYSETSGKSRNWYTEMAINYDRTFGDHHVGFLALYNQSKTYYPATFSSIPTGYIGLVGRVMYDWKSRYMVEFNAGYNGSENYAPKRRMGFFPAGSVGWVISDEPFWKPLKNVVNHMKFRVSVGLVGNDAAKGNRFMYTADPYAIAQSGLMASGNRGAAYLFGLNHTTSSLGAYELSKNNPHITWEKALKRNYGADIKLIKNRLSLGFDYYKEDRKNLMLNDGNAPALLGFTTPLANLGRVNSWGWELSLRWEDKTERNFRYWVGGNISYNQNEIIEAREAPQNNDWLYKQGKRIGSNQLYKFWRFYDEMTPVLYEETFGTPFPDHGLVLRPGDNVYVDLNKDGKIDTEDYAYGLGYTNDPEYTIGLNMGFNWKGFDVSMQWAGAWNVSRVLSDLYRTPMHSSSNPETGGLLKFHYENTWSEANPSQNSFYPRPTFTRKTNNYVNATLYEVNSSYMRLKMVQISYRIKLPFLKKIKVDSCDIALSGTNLLTFTNFIWGDPESSTSNSPSYPLSRSYSLSLKLGF